MLHYRHRRNDQATAIYVIVTCTENVVKSEHVVSLVFRYTNGQTDKQTNRYTDL